MTVNLNDFSFFTKIHWAGKTTMHIQHSVIQKLNACVWTFSVNDLKHLLKERKERKKVITAAVWYFLDLSLNTTNADWKKNADVFLKQSFASYLLTLQSKKTSGSVGIPTYKYTG